MDPNEILRMIDALEKQRLGATSQGAAGLVEQFRNAASSDAAAKDFFYQTKMALDFVGQSQENREFRDWRELFEKSLEASDQARIFPAVVRLHLEYLALSITRARAQSPEEIAPVMVGLEGFASRVAAASAGTQPVGDRGESGRVIRELWQEPITSSPFLRVVNAQQFVANIKDWEMLVSNYAGMYEKSLLTFWRAGKNPKAVEYWDIRLSLLDDRLSKTQLSSAQGRIAGVERPALEWSRAEELAQIGQQNRAVLSKIEIMKRNPNHPDFEKWVQNVRNTLKPPAPTPPPASPAPAQ